MIGWEDVNATVGSRCGGSKEISLKIHPTYHSFTRRQGLYRLVLEHGDFEIHNMSIRGCKQFNTCDVCVRLGNSTHCARDIIRSVDGSVRRSSDK